MGFQTQRLWKAESKMARIALVDDDENILTSVSMYLEDAGYDVQTFNDGVSALAALNAPNGRIGTFTPITSKLKSAGDFLNI